MAPFAIGGPTSKWAKTAVKSANYTILDTDELGIIFVDDTSTDRTITLPTAADNTDRIITIKNTSTDQGKVTVDGEGAETIDGYSTVDLDCKGARIKLISDGSNWQVLEVFFTDKQYSEAAGDFTVTSATGSFVVDLAILKPERGLDGVWRLRGNYNVNSASTSSITISTSGVVFLTADNQAIYIQSQAGVVHNGSTLVTTGDISIVSAANRTNWRFGIDVALDSKPTWVE